jgi:hypothetical protein
MAVANSCARGQGATAHLLTLYDHPRVRINVLTLAPPFPAVGTNLTGRKRADRLLLLAPLF